MNWSGGGKKRFRPRLGLHITKSLFRHQNRIPLVDDRYIQEMISKSKHDNRMPPAEIHATPSMVALNNVAKEVKSPCLDEDSSASLFGDIPVGTPSQPSACHLVEYASPSDDSEVLSLNSKESDASCTMLNCQEPQENNLHEIPESTTESPQIVRNESGLFEGDDLSAYCSPPKDFETCSMKVNRYLLQHTAAAAAYPNVVACKSRSWDTTLQSSTICTPVRKHVRFGAINVDATPVSTEEYSRDPHRTYPKTPILKNTTITETPSQHKSPGIEVSPRKNFNNFTETPYFLNAPQQSMAEICLSEGETVSNACYVDAPNPDYVRGKPEVKKHKNQFLKTKKKLLYKKVVIREKVIHKAFKTVKIRDAATQTTSSS